MQKYKNIEIGRLGEEVAIKFLQKRGYQILDRNFSVTSQGLKLAEIDIIAEDRSSQTIVFVEVKSQEKPTSFLPADRVNKEKLHRIKQTAQVWLFKHKKDELPWRIDIISVSLNFETRKAKIIHFRNIEA